MKFFAASVFALFSTFSVLAQKKPPKGYTDAPALSVNGDFDGDGKPDTLNQFIADSLGNRLDYIIEVDWNNVPLVIDRQGYYTAYTLNGNPTEVEQFLDLGLFCLINMGDVNNRKGDEIALVPLLLDYSNLNTCRIYSYCSGNWQEVFSFAVNENSFSVARDSSPVIFNTIPESLEKRNGKWVYIDFYEAIKMDNPTLKPLKVPNCK